MITDKAYSELQQTIERKITEKKRILEWVKSNHYEQSIRIHALTVELKAWEDCLDLILIAALTE